MQIVLPYTAFIFISNICECMCLDCQMKLPKLIVNILNLYLGDTDLQMHFDVLQKCECSQHSWESVTFTSLWIGS